jgi:hypothetical protein
MSVLCDRDMYRQRYVSTEICIDRDMYRQRYVSTEICIDRDMFDRCNSAQLTSTGERFLCVASPSLYVWHVHNQLVFGESDTIVMLNAENQQIVNTSFWGSTAARRG